MHEFIAKMPVGCELFCDTYNLLWRLGCVVLRIRSSEFEWKRKNPVVGSLNAMLGFSVFDDLD